MKATVLLILLMCGSLLGVAHADSSSSFILTAEYSDYGRITADIDEDEVDPNRYADYSLDVERIRSIQVALPKYYLYAHYTRMDAVDEQGRRYSNRYNAAAIGVFGEMQEYLTDNTRWYICAYAGLGAARFNFDNPRTRAMGEVGGELGLLFFRRVSVGMGVSYSLVGYPSETIAEGGYVSANLGLRL